MNRLILQSTSIAQWYQLVNEAEDSFGHHLDSDLESYLVHLLLRYTNKPDVIGSILALDYLNSIEASGQMRAYKLRDVGDKCLLFSGFFPEVASKRNVTVSYYVELGRRAYDYLALLNTTRLLTADLYNLLKDHFVSLLDLVFSIRELSGEQQALTLIQAEELWRNTGSRYAYKILQKYNEKIITLKNSNKEIQ